jgi:hypothetical protein
VGEVVFGGPATDLSPIDLEVTFAEHFAGRDTVGSGRLAVEPLVQKRLHFGRPCRRVITARNAGSPSGLLMVSARAQIVSVKPVETRSRKAKAAGGSWGLEFLGPERSQHVANQWRSTAMGQLPLFNFSSAEGNRTGGRCPPNPLGFIALCLLQQGG